MFRTDASSKPHGELWRTDFDTSAKRWHTQCEDSVSVRPAAANICCEKLMDSLLLICRVHSITSWWRWMQRSHTTFGASNRTCWVDQATSMAHLCCHSSRHVVSWRLWTSASRHFPPSECWGCLANECACLMLEQICFWFEPYSPLYTLDESVIFQSYCLVNVNKKTNCNFL